MDKKQAPWVPQCDVGASGMDLEKFYVTRKLRNINVRFTTAIYIYILHDILVLFFSAEDEAAASHINLWLHTPSSMTTDKFVPCS